MTRVFFRPDPATPYRTVDYLCLGGPNRLLTPEQLVPDLRQYFEAAAPDFSVRMNPPNGTLTQLPAIFYLDYGTAGAKGSVPTLDTVRTVLGFRIHIVAEPTWTWTFDDDDPLPLTVSTPGAPYPSRDISHTYRSPGRRVVSVAASWTGRFYIEGDGPYDIADPVQPPAETLLVDVRNAHAELVGG